MMNQKIALIFLILPLVWSNFNAQTDEELRFSVVKPKVEVVYSPDYNYLFQNIPHPIEIVVKDSLHSYEFKLIGGTINETDSGTFVTAEANDETILAIYEVDNGEEILVASKNFLVLPEPMVQLQNKMTDNVLLDLVLVSGRLKGVSTFRNKTVILPVTSFRLSYGGRTSTDEILGDEIPSDHRKKIVELNDGSMIYFENVMVEITPGYSVPVPSYRVTMESSSGEKVLKFE